MLYFVQFHSNLLYCIGTLSTMSKTKANKIGKMQNKAIRAITHSKNRQSAPPLYSNLKILPYESLQRQAKLNFMHAVENKYAPKSFLQVWIKNEQRNINYPLRNNDQLFIPTVNFDSLKNIPLFSFPAECNSIGDLRFQTNKITFQIALKEKLLSDL